MTNFVGRARRTIVPCSGSFLLTELLDSGSVLLMQTVIETAAYLRDARRCGIADQDLKAIVNLIAANPGMGDAIEGTGGCRKLRIAGRGKGKSAGYRLITFYSGSVIPVFLLAMFSKGEQTNLSPAERNALKALTRDLFDSYGVKVVRKRR
jgi:hypothetical protein